MFINHTVKALTAYWLRQRRSILFLFACGGGRERAEAERSVSDSFWRGQDITPDPWLPGQTLIHTHTPKVSGHCFPGTRLLTILREGSQREDPSLPSWHASYSGKRDQWDFLFTTHQERKDLAVQSWGSTEPGPVLSTVQGGLDINKTCSLPSWSSQKDRDWLHRVGCKSTGIQPCFP